MRYSSCILVAWIACSACEAETRSEEVRHRAPSTGATPAAPAPVAEPPLAVEVDLPTIAPPPVRLEALCAPLAAATCRVHLGCRSGVTRESLLACESHLATACEAERPRLEARIAAGLLRYDARALRDCVTRLDMTRCGAPGDMQAELGNACDAVLVGRLAAGAVCEDAGDCAPGLGCMSAGTCPGRCEPLRTLGDPCDAELAPCAAGLSCELGRCAPAAVPLEAECITSAQCPDGAFCDDAELGAYCRERRAIGAACDDDEQCAEADYCRFVSLGDDLVIEAGVCATRLHEGAECDPLVGGCAAGLACDETNAVCVALPDAAGEGCVADVSPCGEGTGLQCEAGACELEPFVGDACEPGAADACRFGFCAPLDASGIGECRSFIAPGAPCSGDAECGALACVDGRCDRPAAGRCAAALHDINIGFRYRIR